MSQHPNLKAAAHTKLAQPSLSLIKVISYSECHNLTLRPLNGAVNMNKLLGKLIISDPMMRRQADYAPLHAACAEGHLNVLLMYTMWTPTWSKTIHNCTVRTLQKSA